MNAARFEKVAKGEYEVIDTRTEQVVKHSIKTASKAAAYVEYYNQEIEKANKLWEIK